MSNVQPEWIEVIVSCSAPEEQSALLFALGALGIEIIDLTSLRAFFQLPPADLAQQIEEFGFKIKSLKAVEKENWTGRCSDVWEAVEANGIKIRPVEGIESAKTSPPLPDEILIIPGLGFGTGHHTATQHVLHLLQKVPSDQVRTALDLGTGSGILAIAIAKLFKVPVVAIDNDPLALENAADNLEINQVESVSLIHGTLEQSTEKFDLIAANLYAELLVELSDAIRARLKPGGFIALSGIAEPLLPDVLAAFPWKPLETRLSNGWAGLLYQG